VLFYKGKRPIQSRTKEKGPYNREQRKKAHIIENKGKRPIQSRTKEKGPYNREQRKKDHRVKRPFSFVLDQ
jgi:hypothetical protein